MEVMKGNVGMPRGLVGGSEDEEVELGLEIRLSDKCHWQDMKLEDGGRK
jgi:hypothetical protein